jgi:hypothetical protein
MGVSGPIRAVCRSRANIASRECDALSVRGQNAVGLIAPNGNRGRDYGHILREHPTRHERRCRRPDGDQLRQSLSWRGPIPSRVSV